MDSQNPTITEVLASDLVSEATRETLNKLVDLAQSNPENEVLLKKFLELELERIDLALEQEELVDGLFEVEASPVADNFAQPMDTSSVGPTAPLATNPIVS